MNHGGRFDKSIEDWDDVPPGVSTGVRWSSSSKLDEDGRESLAADLDDPPDAAGYDAEEWTPELVQRHLEEEYDVTYSLGHIRRLVKELRA